MEESAFPTQDRQVERLADFFSVDLAPYSRENRCMREITAQAPGDRRGIDANGNPGIDQESSQSAGKQNLAPGLSAPL